MLGATTDEAVVEEPTVDHSAVAVLLNGGAFTHNDAEAVQSHLEPEKRARYSQAFCIF